MLLVSKNDMEPGVRPGVAYTSNHLIRSPSRSNLFAFVFTSLGIVPRIEVWGSCESKARSFDNKRDSRLVQGLPVRMSELLRAGP